MNWKHLIWIIPLCLFAGFMINYYLQIGLTNLGWELAQMIGEAHSKCDSFVNEQDKCLYETRAENYSGCYWKAKETQKEFKIIEI